MQAPLLAAEAAAQAATRSDGAEAALASCLSLGWERRCQEPKTPALTGARPRGPAGPSLQGSLGIDESVNPDSSRRTTQAMVAAPPPTPDGSAEQGDALPGPADLLTAAFAACAMKNVERFSHLLPFAYEQASITVRAERQDTPPRIIAVHYDLQVTTDEPSKRIELLHDNIRRHGTIFTPWQPCARPPATSSPFPSDNELTTDLRDLARLGRQHSEEPEQCRP